jgi:hypothetical protein
LVDAGDLVVGSPGLELIDLLLLHVVVDGLAAIQRRQFAGRDRLRSSQAAPASRWRPA